MTGASKKRTSTPQKAEQPGDISIGGSVSGTGNVVGHGSSSKITQPTALPTRRSRASKLEEGQKSSLLWVQLFAFLFALSGILAAIVVFVRLLQAVEAWALIQFVLAAIVAALGISGIAKPQSVVHLLAKMFGKG